jgi:hypothetical protein
MRVGQGIVVIKTVERNGETLPIASQRITETKLSRFNKRGRIGFTLEAKYNNG